MKGLTINIGGKERYLSYGLKSVSEIIDHFGGFSEAGEKLRNNILLSTPVIIYYGVLNGAMRNSQVVDFTINDAFDWVDDKGFKDKELNQAVTLFSTSMTSYIEDLMPETEEKVEDDAKKK